MEKQGKTYTENYNAGNFKHWCSGLTKETSDIVANISTKVSDTVNDKVKNNEWHVSFSKSRTYDYKGIKLYGEWEVNFAKYLDSHNIIWERPDICFDYVLNGKNHKYTPDFYIPKHDIYIEIKGYPTQKDYCKWEQFKGKLNIYFGDDLYELGIIDSYRDVYTNVDSKFRLKYKLN